ncbi:sugar kinase [Streptomyces sp. NPDC018947]|uniref:sugar kinase n=1 Tax=Streptomyces sp. NPDC018947 TaxID=3365054 RepID=UPI0037A15F23
MTEPLTRRARTPQEPPLDPGPPAEDRRHMIRRRTLTLLIIVLLIGVPAGYLVISANQSRDSGKVKEAKYSATGLTEGWPSKLQRRLYEVPVPMPSKEVAYYETNNWKTSRLYVQFETTSAGLDAFLAGIGATRNDLERDETISDRDQHITGWNFDGPGPFWGLVRKQAAPAPTRDVLVDLAEPDRPMVYVVSRTVP